LIAFDLKNGRRKEPLADQQVANAAGAQLAANHQVLAQQLASAIDPQSLSNLAESRLNGAGNGFGRVPFFGGGAVGYQPIIIWLPAGANLMGPGGGGITAVVSADRRYVRISASPLFSGISKVDTFNMSSGSTTSQSGPGNQGYSGQFGGSGNSGTSGSGLSGGTSGGGVF